MNTDILCNNIVDWIDERVKNEFLSNALVKYLGAFALFFGIAFFALTVGAVLLGIASIICGYILTGILILLFLPATMFFICSYGFSIGFNLFDY